MSGHLLRTAFLTLSLFILNATATAETLVPIMVDEIIIFVPAVTPTPEVPTLTLPSNDSDGTYTISWSDVFGATNYQMEGELSGVLYDGPALSTSRSKPSGSYSYKVKACNSSGCSASTLLGTFKVGELGAATYKNENGISLASRVADAQKSLIPSSKEAQGLRLVVAWLGVDSN